MNLPLKKDRGWIEFGESYKKKGKGLDAGYKQKKYMEWKNYIVCLVDILGQSRKLDELGSIWWETKDSGDVAEKKSKRIAELTKETYGEVKYFRKLFSDSFNVLKTFILKDPKMDTLSPVERAVVTEMATDICTIRSFSDMIVFYAPLNFADDLLTRFRIAAMLYACVCVLIVEFKSGTFFRGGIEIGAGTELGNGDIYGPVLGEAHRLEEKVAVYPRIVIGKRLNESIQNEGQESDKGEFLNSVLARVKKDLFKDICRDDDGQIIVDYLGEGAAELNQSNQSQYSRACSFVQEGMAKVKDKINEHRKNGEKDLVERYERLLAYYQSRMKYWTGNQ